MVKSDVSAEFENDQTDMRLISHNNNNISSIIYPDERSKFY